MRVEVIEFAPAPRELWSCYPGRRPDYSYLFCGDHLRRVDPDGFDAVLRRLHAAPMDDRQPVVAYGSNACPAQLADKYQSTGRSALIPMSTAWLHGVAIGYSDHVTTYGAVPANAFVATGVRTGVFLAWLDEEQLSALDDSERRNYRRRSLDLDVHQLTVVDGESPNYAGIYLSTRGLFTVDGVAPGMAGIASTYTDGPLLTQIEVKRLRGAGLSIHERER